MGSLLSNLRLAIRVLPVEPRLYRGRRRGPRARHRRAPPIFSVVNAVLLAPLPYPEAERILGIQRGFKSQPDGGGGSVSNPQVHGLADIPARRAT